MSHERIPVNAPSERDARQRAHLSIYVGMISLARGIDHAHASGIVEQRSGVRLDRALHPVITTIGERGPIRTGPLAEALALTPSTVSRHVTRLVELGLVERTQDGDDARASLIELSEEGNRTFDALRSTWGDLIAEVFGDTDLPDLEAFMIALNAFGSGLSRIDAG
jgi:DNA-binding MarR family transcriptional regulator